MTSARAGSKAAGKWRNLPRQATDPKTLVRQGWNRLSTKYRPPRRTTDCFLHTEDDYRRWLQPLFDEIAELAPVLDLGCGNGVPAARLLSARFRVTGVDISDVMVRRARRSVPKARFVCADMADVEFPTRSFDGVVSFYSIIHLPLLEQQPLLRRIHSWLRPAGTFVAILGHRAFEGIEANWLNSGVTMYWSHADARTYARWLRAAGFTVRHQEFVPEGEGGHERFWATRRQRSPKSRA